MTALLKFYCPTCNRSRIRTLDFDHDASTDRVVVDRECLDCGTGFVERYKLDSIETYYVPKESRK